MLGVEELSVVQAAEGAPVGADLGPCNRKVTMMATRVVRPVKAWSFFYSTSLAMSDDETIVVR
ncbi:hypothetical protein AMTR_s00032p00217180 [Amborella trichopoda]|uniref:Uncharacterized protein n=1 Tax=Amborella trichopoda TaxID=13333 RepID=U5CP73_AMBTC|nr:hypothetical protein AMTR_s00032p00217180 [Amborella trichopoda]